MKSFGKFCKMKRYLKCAVCTCDSLQVCLKHCFPELHPICPLPISASDFSTQLYSWNISRLDDPPGKDVSNKEDVSRGGKSDCKREKQRQQQEEQDSIATASLLVKHSLNGNQTQEDCHGEEDEADDDSSPDGISLVDQVQPIQDIGHNVEDKEEKIWLGRVFNRYKEKSLPTEDQGFDPGGKIEEE